MILCTETQTHTEEGGESEREERQGEGERRLEAGVGRCCSKRVQEHSHTGKGREESGCGMGYWWRGNQELGYHWMGVW